MPVLSFNKLRIFPLNVILSTSSLPNKRGMDKAAWHVPLLKVKRNTKAHATLKQKADFGFMSERFGGHCTYPYSLLHGHHAIIRKDFMLERGHPPRAETPLLEYNIHHSIMQTLPSNVLHNRLSVVSANQMEQPHIHGKPW